MLVPFEMAAAIVDRLLHNATVQNIRGHSYGVRGDHADLWADRLAGDLKARRATYYRKTLGLKDWLRRLWSTCRQALAELEYTMRGGGGPPTRPT